MLLTNEFESTMGLEPIYSTTDPDGNPATVGEEAARILRDNFKKIEGVVNGISSPLTINSYYKYILRSVRQSLFTNISSIQVTRLKNTNIDNFYSYIELKATLSDSSEVLGIFRRKTVSSGLEDVDIIFYAPSLLERIILSVNWDELSGQNLSPANLFMDISNIPLSDILSTQKMVYERGVQSYNYTDIILGANKLSSLSSFKSLQLTRLKNTATATNYTYVELKATLQDDSTVTAIFGDTSLSSGVRECRFVFYVSKEITEILTINIDFSKVSSDNTYTDFNLLPNNFTDSTLTYTTKSLNSLGVQTFIPANTNLLQKYSLSIDAIGQDEDLWDEGYLGANDQVYAGTGWYTWKKYEPVHPNSIVTYMGWLSGNARILVLDKSKNTVKVIAAASNNRLIDIEIPQNGDTLRFCIQKTSTNTAPALVMKNDFIYVKSGTSSSATNGISNLTLKNNLRDQLSLLPEDITTTGVYGQDNCIYNIPINVDNGMLRVKFDFKINENVHQTAASKLLASLGDINVSVNPSSTINLLPTPCIRSNFSFSMNTESLKFLAPSYNQHIGNDAFWLRTTLDPTVAANQDICVSNKLGIFKIYHSLDNSIISQLTLSDYVDMTAFFKAVEALPNIECGFVEIMRHLPTELVEFDAIPLVGEYTLQLTSGTQWDASRCYVPYAIDTKYHIFELQLKDGKACMSIDGVTLPTINFSLSSSTTLVLGSATLQCTLRNLHIDYKHVGESELVYYNLYSTAKNNPKLISEYNPAVCIFEGHGIDDTLEADGFTSDNLAAPIERLEYVFNYMKSKGYVPVSLQDIIDWYAGKPMPSKRVYTIVMDDYRYQNYMNLEFREVFSKYGVKPALAWITDKNDPIVVDGVTYDRVTMLRNMQKNNWYPHSHTRDHRALSDNKGSELFTKLSEDIRSAESVEIYSQCITYPYGYVNANVIKAAERIGFGLGIMTVVGSFAELGRNKYYCGRQEIGIRNSIDIVLSNIL